MDSGLHAFAVAVEGVVIYVVDSYGGMWCDFAPGYDITVDVDAAEVLDEDVDVVVVDTVLEDVIGCCINIAQRQIN